MIMKGKNWLIISAVIMIIVGALRAVGGIALLAKGNQLDTEVPIIASDMQIYIVSIGLMIIGILFVYASTNLVRKYSKKCWNLCWIVLLLFLLMGLLNGYLLFGQPLDQGQKINLTVAILVGLFLFLGKSALKTEK
ncbi:MAG: hypothetical protein D6767_07860 [Candidatus Hydrogenedentota bacterium]|nr:MAG: hypothetical protein D6767_07860 [Candidatus Hydrogenedentota bacterium]